MTTTKIPVLYVMVGIPGSGKTVKAQELSTKYNAKVFSSDEYRVKLCGDANCQEKNSEVFTLLYKDLKAELQRNKNCILDATNTTLKSRLKIFNVLKGVEFTAVAYVMTTSIITCTHRDLLRDKHVGGDVIDRFATSYQHPQCFEGFSQIILDKYEEHPPKFNPFDTHAIWNTMQLYAQQNPHHRFTLGEHCYRLASMYKTDSVEYIAGLCHDIGKIFTRTFDEEGVAHYFSHDSVGTLYVLSNLEMLPCKSIEEVNEVLFFINYHMRGHKDFRTTKAEAKYRKLFGDELFNRLIEFAECDKIASGTYYKEVTEC